MLLMAKDIFLWAGGEGREYQKVTHVNPLEQQRMQCCLQLL